MKKFLKTLGPGVLFASTAIGVSHLIQSTQAGGNFGFTLVWAILLANIFKYPFFEYGSRYANATGTTLIQGYSKLGPFAIWSFFIITFISMFLVTATVGNVTAGFMQNLFGIKSVLLTTLLLFTVCVLILFSGNYKVLDNLIKVIGIVLLVSTLAAFCLVVLKGKQGNLPLWEMQNFSSDAYWLFLIPLMGWMPTAVDLSAWSSIWTLERIKQTGYKPTLKETLREFNLGYWISALLAICFVTLGAFIMFGTGKTFSTKSVAFSREVIDLYTQTFGDWSTLIIAASAFSIMFSTCIAVFDGYSRAMAATSREVFSKTLSTISDKKMYRALLLLIAVGSFLIIFYFQSNPNGFLKLVVLATSISFLFAPFIAIYNLLLVSGKHIDENAKPNKFMRWLSYIGIVFLTVFSVFYLLIDYLLPYL